jgi:hypothetical protein
MRQSTIIKMAAGKNPWYDSGIRYVLLFLILSPMFYRQQNPLTFKRRTSELIFQTSTCSIRLKPSGGLTVSQSIL